MQEQRCLADPWRTLPANHVATAVASLRQRRRVRMVLSVCYTLWTSEQQAGCGQQTHRMQILGTLLLFSPAQHVMKTSHAQATIRNAYLCMLRYVSCVPCLWLRKAGCCCCTLKQSRLS
jgi:hypothetical protein